ncbi:type II toxin-antitoxin system RelE/ParE family toxin [Chryseobacterium sp. C39-AII1]|uniref:type II toxin-antitoxin system RelE/ParE family toxin n=1 Tax=Chryseobacterium sp. C39-AII1 TaxID=3080332 RepID=UPI00320B81B8
MEIKLIYSPFVKQDLKEINDWYKKINKKLWINFMKEFRSKINFIKENPLSFEFKYDHNRIVFLKKFPYGIHYSYNAEENIIEIYSIFHTSRDPEQWKERK